MPDIQIVYYLWVILLVLSAGAAWSLNFVALPGNWIVVGLAALFVSVVTPRAAAEGITWATVGLLAAMALGGEVLETLAGAMGAAKQGASKRAVALAIVGTIAGSIFGAIGGLPLPVAGPILGALVGGACGAFVGAYLGEMWKHGLADRSAAVGVGAAIGRVLGTLGKLAVGAVMVVVLCVQALS